MFTDPLDPAISVPGVYYIDYSTNPDGSAADPDLGVYYCALPEKLHFDDAISGPGTCSWEWSMSALDMEDERVISHNFMGPWRSYYRLRCGNDIIMSGPISGVSSKLNDQFVSLAGKTWEGYYGRYQFPFDPRPDHVNDFVFPNSFIGNEDTASGTPTPTGLVYQAQNRDVILIARDIIKAAVHDVAYRLNFPVQELDTPVGIRTNFQLTLGDQTFLDGFLNNLVGIGEGFDWWIGTISRKLRVGSPYRYGSNLSPFIAYTFVKDTPGLLDVELDNSGIEASHVLGRGAGLASQTQLGSAFGSLDNQVIFHRLDASYDLGDVRNRDQLEQKTRKRLVLSTKPVNQVTVSIDPAMIDGFWPTFRKGRAVWLAIDLGWHEINAPYQIQSFTCAEPQGSETGAMQVDMTLKEIYPLTVSDNEFYADL